MSTKTISITEEAYECLRSLKDSQSDSFSQVIIKYIPKKRSLSEIFADMDPDGEFADAILSVVREGRSGPEQEI